MCNKIVVAKKNKKRSNAAGASKKVSRPSRKNKEKKHQSERLSDLQKLQIYNNKKAEEQQSKYMSARQKALEKMGVPVEQQQFGYEDHREIYNYAQERAPFNQPPIKMIDASVAPPEVTSYPEYPRSDFSSPPAFDLNGAVLKPEVACKSLSRAKKIFQLSQLNGA